MNHDRLIDRLLDAYRDSESETIVDAKCQALMDTLRDPARMKQLVAESTHEPVSTFKPREFGDFKLTGWLGAGGMGQVYRAVHSDLGREQALKMLPADRVTNAQAMNRFKREIRAIAQLNHPSIVTVYDAGKVDGTPYLTMELIDGLSLSEFIRNAKREGRQIEIADACRMIADAADGIQHAHENGVVHRDIKPRNLMLDTRGNVRILDLGLAKFVDGPKQNDPTIDSGEADNQDAPNLNEDQLTAAQQILGTPDYMSPEQISAGGEVDARADVYALAATLQHLLTGEPPFADSGSSLLSKAVAVLQKPAPRLSDNRDDVPAGLDDAIALSLSKDPDDRPQTAAAFAAILRNHAKLASASKSIQPATQPASQSVPPGRRVALWLLALLPAGVAIAGILMVLQGKDGSTLRIESNEPNVKVIATWAGETEPGSDDAPMQLEISPGKPARLRAGEWSVSIDGDQRMQYELSQTKFTLEDGDNKRLVVTRLPTGSIEHPTAPSVETPKISSSVATQTTSRPSDAELLKRFETVDWKPGKQDNRHYGEVALPATIDGIPNWQLQSTFPVGADLVNVSPKGTYIVARVPFARDFYIYVRESGRLCGVVGAGDANLSDVEWSPDETRLLAFNERYLRQGRMFSPDGTYLHDWKNGVSNASFYWSPDGERILAVNGDTMEMRDSNGDVVDSFASPGHGMSGQQFVHPWSPDGSMFAIRYGGKLRIYDKDGGDPVSQIPCVNTAVFRWHPSGKYVLLYQQGDVRLCTTTGESRVLVQKYVIDIVPSPDGKFVCTDKGEIYSISGKKISQIELPYQAGWRGNSIHWEEADKLTVFSGNEVGSFVEMTPTGKRVREVARPVPLPVTLGTWRNNTNRLVTCFPSTDEYHLNSKWIFNWDENGAGSSLEFSERFGTKQGTGASIGWDQVNERLSVADANGVHTFDLAGKLVSHLAEGTYPSQATWSPDGKKLAIAFHYQADVLVYEDGEQKKFTFKGARKSVQWLADSNRLVVDYTDSDRYAIVSLEDSEVVQFESRCSYPVSPSGSRTVIVEDREENLVHVTLRQMNGEPRTFDFEGSTGDYWQCHWNDDESEFVLVGFNTQFSFHYDIDVGKLVKRDLNTYHSDDSWYKNGFLALYGNTLSHWPSFDHKPVKLTLPKKSQNVLFARGRGHVSMQGDSKFVSPNSRYVSLILNVASFHGKEFGGNLCVADLQEHKVAWTGVAYNDGNRAVIDNQGRVREASEDDFDKYLTYTVAYTDHEDLPPRVVPLTRMQFAARIGLSKPQQVLQTVLDLGGRLTLSENRSLVASDLNDARDLPQASEVVGVFLANSRYLTNDVANMLAHLPKLRKLDVSGTKVDVASLTFLESLTALKSLDVSGHRIDDSFSHVMPDSITELDVSHTSVGDFFLFDMRQMESLRKLNVTATKVTQKAVDKLRKQLPDCEIIFAN